MKKVLSVILVFVILCSTFAGLQITSHALASSGSCGDNVTYTFDSETGTLTISGTGTMDNYSYNSIDSTCTSVFSKTSIKTVIIETGVTSIGDWAFYKCGSLKSITIPNSVTNIGYSAFYNCYNLTGITISNSVTSIGDRAFYNCNKLTSVTIGNSVTSIGSATFFYCSSLTSITIPDSVTSIGREAFFGCSGLTSITIGNSVTSIGYGAFSGTAYYGDLNNWENDVLYVGNHLINAKSNISGKYDIKPGTKTILDTAFRECSSLTSVTIPDSVTSIGSFAFENCSRLTSVTIPDSVTSIGTFAFQYCSGLKELTIPCSVEIAYRGSTFYGCTNIEKVTLTKGTGTMRNYDNGRTTEYTPWYHSRNNLKEVYIEDGIKNIVPSAFSGCSSLTSITIPDSVTSIGNVAFNGSAYFNDSNNWENDVLYIGNHLIRAKSNLSGKYDIKPGTKTIADSAFYYCEELASVTIPDSVTSIGDRAFYNCNKLTSVTIGNSVTSIGSEAFYGCSKLTSITIPNSVTSIGNYAFYGCSGLTSAIIGNSVTSIGNYAFSGCSGLSSTTIPKSVTSIGSCAFEGCSGLKNVNIPYSVTKISSSAFRGCSSLISITIPNSVTSIGDYAFYGCGGLTSVTIPDSVTSIGDYAFSGCGGLTSVTIPDSVTSIGREAFFGCIKLTSLTIPDSVTSIGSGAFYSCSGLTSLTIGNSVTSIGSEAFYNCSKLTSITIPDSVTSIGREAFFVYGESYGCESYGCNVTASCKFTSLSSNGDRSWTKIHKLGSISNTTPSTCTDKGYTTYICADCGQPYNDTYVNSLGHIYKKTVTKATTKSNGKIVTTCSRCGESKTTVIYYPKTIKLSKTAFSYNKKVQKPTVKVLDSKGKTIAASNYKVTYSTGCKNVGKYTVKVTFKGNYSGSKTVTYLIRPAVSPSAKALLVGQTLKLNTKSSKSCIFGSSNKKVATVNKKGVVTAKSAGTAKIVVKSNGIANTVTIKVVKPGITLNRSGLVLYKGRSATIKATTYPSKYKVKWSTSNSRVATVSGGKVKAVGKGTAIITAKITCAGKTYKKNCKVVVKTLSAPSYTAQCSDYGRLRITFPTYYNYNYLDVQACIDKSFDSSKYSIKRGWGDSCSYYEYYTNSGNTYYVRARQFDYDNNGNIVYSPWGKTIRVYVK